MRHVKASRAISFSDITERIADDIDGRDAPYVDTLHGFGCALAHRRVPCSGKDRLSSTPKT